MIKKLGLNEKITTLLLTSMFGLGAVTSLAQTFSGYELNPFSLEPMAGTANPEMVDLDGDGDLDLMVGTSAGTLSYYENTGSASSPSFATAVISPFSIPYIGTGSHCAFGDFDNDGDLDLMGANQGGDFVYCENVGSSTSPEFGTPMYNPFSLVNVVTADGAIAVYDHSLADLDNDGDLDLIIGHVFGDFYYFENEGTASSPSFGPFQVNPFGLTNNGEIDGTAGPTFVDLDHDGDFDILCGENSAGNLHFYENSGTSSSPNFETKLVNPFGFSAIGGALLQASNGDLDNDGDQDIIMGNSTGGFYYFENEQPLSVNEYENLQVSIYPNPAESFVIVSVEGNELVEYVVRSVDGRIVKEGISSDSKFQLDLSDQQSGIYLLEIESNTQHQTRIINKL